MTMMQDISKSNDKFNKDEFDGNYIAIGRSMDTEAYISYALDLITRDANVVTKYKNREYYFFRISYLSKQERSFIQMLSEIVPHLYKGYYSLLTTYQDLMEVSFEEHTARCDNSVIDPLPTVEKISQEIDFKIHKYDILSGIRLGNLFNENLNSPGYWYLYTAFLLSKGYSSREIENEFRRIMPNYSVNASKVQASMTVAADHLERGFIKWDELVHDALTALLPSSDLDDTNIARNKGYLVMIKGSKDTKEPAMSPHNSQLIATAIREALNLRLELPNGELVMNERLRGLTVDTPSEGGYYHLLQGIITTIMLTPANSLCHKDPSPSFLKSIRDNISIESQYEKVNVIKGYLENLSKRKRFSDIDVSTFGSRIYRPFMIQPEINDIDVTYKELFEVRTKVINSSIELLFLLLTARGLASCGSIAIKCDFFLVLCGKGGTGKTTLFNNALPVKGQLLIDKSLDDFMNSKDKERYILGSHLISFDEIDIQKITSKVSYSVRSKINNQLSGIKNIISCETATRRKLYVDKPMAQTVFVTYTGSTNKAVFRRNLGYTDRRFFSVEVDKEHIKGDINEWIKVRIPDVYRSCKDVFDKSEATHQGLINEKLKSLIELREHSNLLEDEYTSTAVNLLISCASRKQEEDQEVGSGFIVECRYMTTRRVTVTDVWCRSVFTEDSEGFGTRLDHETYETYIKPFVVKFLKSLGFRYYKPSDSYSTKISKEEEGNHMLDKIARYGCSLDEVDRLNLQRYLHNLYCPHNNSYNDMHNYKKTRCKPTDLEF